jgi:hypothetical protein
MSAIPAWVSIKRSLVYPKWEVKEVVFVQDGDPCWNASVNAYLLVLDKHGIYQAGIKVWQDWKDDRASDFTKAFGDAPTYCLKKYGTTFYMSGDSSFNPGKGEVGPYAFYVDGTSDRVEGCGLPLKRHCQYLITWGWTDSPTPPPPTTGHWETEPSTDHDAPGRQRWVSE